MNPDQDKSQYQTPRTVYNEELYSHIEQSLAPATPEVLRPPFQFADDVGALLDSFRDTAEALEQKDGRTIKVKYVPVTWWRPGRTHEEIIRSQKDTERALTTYLFHEKKRYGVHYSNAADVPNSHPDARHWYIEEAVDGVFDGSKVTHIETYPNAIYMFDHNGQAVPMTIANLEVFVPLVKHYPQAVISAYPFDRDRADIILDGIEFPDNVTTLLPPTHYNQNDDRRAA